MEKSASAHESAEALAGEAGCAIAVIDAASVVVCTASSGARDDGTESDFVPVDDWLLSPFSAANRVARAGLDSDSASKLL